MKIGFIGAGKVGTSLGKYFTVNHLSLSGYYSKSMFSSIEAANFTASKAYKTMDSLVNESDLIFITTPDDILSTIILDICNLNLEDKIICHTSGSLSSEIFSSQKTSGISGYAIHPMFPFSDKFSCYKNLKDAYFSIEGPPKDLERLKTFFETLGNSVFFLGASKKPLYHLANVMASNLVLSLLDLSCEYLSQCGIEKKEAFSALFPLIEGNLTKIKNSNTMDALTGPIDRGDFGTLVHHLEVIPKAQEALYKSLSLQLVEIAKRKHPERDYTEIFKLLGGISFEKHNYNLSTSKKEE